MRSFTVPTLLSLLAASALAAPCGWCLPKRAPSPAPALLDVAAAPQASPGAPNPASSPAVKRAPASAAPAAGPGTAGGILRNNCPFALTVWMAGSPGACNAAAGCATSPVQIPPGGVYNAEIFPKPEDRGGVTIKAKKDGGAAAGSVYQVEYSVAGGKVWYNFSKEDGTPLVDTYRSLKVDGVPQGGSCREMVCQEGSSQCDWSHDAATNTDANIGDCPVGTVVATFCRG